MWGGGRNHRRTARMNPDKTPAATSRMPLANARPTEPDEKAMACITPKPVMANTSSKLDAAKMSVGMPWATPKPSTSNRIMLGTTTAGDTAASTKLVWGKSEIIYMNVMPTSVKFPEQR